MIEPLVPRAHVAGLKFDKEAHRYTMEGIVLPTTTGIIRAGGMSFFGTSAPSVTTPNMQIGKWIHDMLRMHFLGTLVEDSLSHAMRHILGRVKEWADDNAIAPLAVEVPLAHSVYWYGGTPDLVARRVLKDEIAVVDWKSGSAQASDVLQLGGYVELVRDCYDVGNTKIVAIPAYLKDMIIGRKPRTIRGIELEGARGVFLAAHACYKWRSVNGMLPAEEKHSDAGGGQG